MTQLFKKHSLEKKMSEVYSSFFGSLEDFFHGTLETLKTFVKDTRTFVEVVSH